MVNIDQNRKMERSSYGEFVRLYNELTTPKKTVPLDEIANVSHSDHRTKEIDNPNYIGDLQTMTESQIKAFEPKSQTQREFLQRWIDVMKNRQTEKVEEYIGEAGIHKKQRILKKDTELIDISRK